jgi:hypothetical protein
MTTNLTPAAAGTTDDRELMAAARMMLQRMGVDPADLMTDPADRPPVPTFDAYIPEVEKAASPGTAKTYGSYRNRIRAKWGPRTLLEPTATEIKQFEEEIKANAVPRRNSRGGRGTAENFIAALRCIYRHAENDGLIKPDENPARRTRQTPPPGLQPTRPVHRPNERDQLLRRHHRRRPRTRHPAAPIAHRVSLPHRRRAGPTAPGPVPDLPERRTAPPAGSQSRAHS